jgi:pimeloyl-ACP methyl ester carboxylesterase
MTSEDRLAPLSLRTGEEGRTHCVRLGSGESVILIHGVGMNASVWAPQIDALAQNYDVVAYDLLGHGGSSLPPSHAQLQDYTNQLLQLQDNLGIGAAHIVGHSMGALVAIDFALAHPERANSVVALNAVYRRTREQRAAVLRRAQTLEGAGSDGVAQNASLVRWFGDPIPQSLREQAAVAQRLLRNVDSIGYARAYGLFASSDEAHYGRLPTLAMPALFLTGELDLNSTPAMSRAMADAAPQGQCEIIARARHMMALATPDEVNTRLVAFLRFATKRAVQIAEHMDDN